MHERLRLLPAIIFAGLGSATLNPLPASAFDGICDVEQPIPPGVYQIYIVGPKHSSELAYEAARNEYNYQSSIKPSLFSDAKIEINWLPASAPDQALALLNDLSVRSEIHQDVAILVDLDPYVSEQIKRRQPPLHLVDVSSSSNSSSSTPEDMLERLTHQGARRALTIFSRQHDEMSTEVTSDAALDPALDMRIPAK